MPTILPYANSVSELPSLIEDNQYELFVHAARSANRSLHESKTITWVMGNPCLWPRGIFRTRFDEASADQEIQGAVQNILDGKAPQNWMAGPMAQPFDLPERLERHGFRKFMEVAGMAADLRSANADIPKPASLEIQIVHDSQSLQDWVRILGTELFRFQQEQLPGLASLLSLFLDDPCLVFFIGLLDGKPVATSALYLNGQAAGIYHVATGSAFRNKGIGTHMTLAPMLHARQIGYEIAVLQASPIGKPVYSKIGFQEHCQLLRYVYAG